MSFFKSVIDNVFRRSDGQAKADAERGERQKSAGPPNIVFEYVVHLLETRLLAAILYPWSC